MKYFYLKENKFHNQYCFIAPNVLHIIDDVEKQNIKPTTLEEYDKCVQNNNWPIRRKKIEQVRIKLTNKCNYTCIHCLENASPLNKDFINFNSIIQFLKEFKKYNQNGKVVLTGGEPLLHPDIYDILTTIARIGTPIILYSNGTLIAQGKFNNYLKYFESIHLSIDGFSETVNDSIRGKGAFENLVQALAVLKNTNLPITLSCTLFSFNIKDIEQNLFSFIEKYYFENITLNFDYVRPIGRGKKIAASFEKSIEYKVRIKKLLNSDNLKAIKKTNLDYCTYGQSITIEPNGDYYACSHPDSFIGNYCTFNDVRQKIKLETEFMINRAKSICGRCVLAWVCSGGCFLENRSSCDIKKKKEALIRMKYGEI